MIDQKLKEILNPFRKKLQRELRQDLRKLFKSRSGRIYKSLVSIRYKAKLPDRIVIQSPYYSFIQNFGYILKNGNRKPPTKHFDNLLNNKKGELEKVSTKLAEAMSDEIALKINFLKINILKTDKNG